MSHVPLYHGPTRYRVRVVSNVDPDDYWLAGKAMPKKEADALAASLNKTIERYRVNNHVVVEEEG